MPVVLVQMWEGRSKTQKAELAKAITDALVTIGNARPEGVTVIFDEFSKDNWATAGKLAADQT